MALPQASTDIGHSSYWYPGSLVVDLAHLNDGMAIANFVFIKQGVGDSGTSMVVTSRSS